MDTEKIRRPTPRKYADRHCENVRRPMLRKKADGHSENAQSDAEKKSRVTLGLNPNAQTDQIIDGVEIKSEIESGLS